MSIRLNKLLAWRGLGARRKCDTLIESGVVRVNGKVVREPGTQVEPERDRIEVAGRRIPNAPELRYFALNKPLGVITTLDDPEGRRSLREFLPAGPRVYPVGRLDADTSGLLILTNDGELAHKLMHPRYGVEKHYRVRVGGMPTPTQLGQLARGVEFEPGVTSAPARATLLESSNEESKIALTIHEGRYRQVRRMCEAVGLTVLSLHRAGYGPIRLGPLARGTWRELSEDEVERLRAGSARPLRRGGPRLTEFDRAQRRMATARGVAARREREERNEGAVRSDRPSRGTRRDAPIGARPVRERRVERDVEFESGGFEERSEPRAGGSGSSAGTAEAAAQ